MHNEQVFNSNSLNKFIEANQEKQSQLMSFKIIKDYIRSKNFIYYKPLFYWPFLCSVIILNTNNYLYRSLPVHKGYLYLSLVYVSLGILTLSSIRFPTRIAYPHGFIYDNAHHFV